jgi:hypothetical protein
VLYELKVKVSEDPVLRGPNWTLPFHISMNASDTTIREVLGQLKEKYPYAIYYVSKNLLPAKLNYMVTEKEFLVVIHAINKYRHDIIVYFVILHTDHVAIKHLMNKQNTNDEVTRWLLLLQEFDITILEKPRKDNVVVEFISRITSNENETMVEDHFPDEHLFAQCLLTHLDLHILLTFWL